MVFNPLDRAVEKTLDVPLYYTGKTDEITAAAGPDTKRIDLHGRLVIPGLNDAHAELPMPLEVFKLSTNAESTVADVGVALISAADESPASTWIIGTVGPAVIHDLTAAALEKTAPGRKVMLMSPDGRARMMSVPALSALRIGWSVSDPAGGWFERDANGHINGKAFEYAASNAAHALTAEVTDDQAVEALQEFASRALRSGITSVQSAADFPLTRYEKIVRHADVALRIRMIRSPQTDAHGRETGEGSSLPKSDNERRLSVISGTNWMIDETNAEGRLNFPPAEIARIVAEASASNDQLVLTVGGSRAGGSVLDAMKAMSGVDWKSKRVRVDNPDAFFADLLAAARPLGVVVVESPAHPAVALKSLLGAGVPLAFSSGGESNPFRNIMLASTPLRRRLAFRS